MSVLSGFSQPSEYSPSQSPQSAVQLSTSQAEPVQVGVPCATLHVMPHPPQAVTLLVVAVSQPLPTSPSQLAKPALHTMPHAPFVHDGVPWFELQALLHPPQWAMLVLVLASQPVSAEPSQFA